MTSRIQYIDQLKGLAMLMVIFGHLLQFSLGIHHTTWLVLLETFDLPLFFFICGYFCYRSEHLSARELGAQLLKKARAYLLPLLSVGTLYCVLTDYSFRHLVLSGGGKLWFLYTLFLLSCLGLILGRIFTPPIWLEERQLS